MLALRDKTILAIAPHVDDVELGAGGLIHRLLPDNDIHYLGLSMPPSVDKKVLLAEFHASIALLGLDKSKILLRDYDPRNLFDKRLDILQLFYDLYQELKPDLVLIPTSTDVHQSHEVVHAEAVRAFKYTTILGYEMPWNNLRVSLDVFMTLSAANISAKVDAINAYATQKERVFFSNDIVEDLARVRGKSIGREYAEAFELVRLIA